MDKSTKEVIAKWKAGETVWSAELGGLGPAYEQCIQILLFTILARWPKNRKMPKADGKGYPVLYEQHVEKVVSELDKRYGFSGAQVGVAKVTAWQFITYGYKAMMDKLPSDRRIQVSRDFPVAA